MIAFQEIVCPVDFSESSIRAFAHAVALVRWYGAHLTVLHVIPPFDLAQMPGNLGDPVRIPTSPRRERVLDEMSRFFDLADVSPQASLLRLG